jgi:hypothetical protein
MANFYERSQGFFFWDTDGSGTNPIARYQCVSLATAAEVADAIAAGNTPANVGVGDVVVRTPLSGGVPQREVIGVTMASGWSLGQVSAEPINVQVDGIALVQFGGAVAFNPGTLISAGSSETRTSLQTPFTNNFDMLIPIDARVSLTYRLCLASALAITPASTGANAAYYPLGFMLDVASAKYDILRVDMTRCPKVIYA